MLAEVQMSEAAAIDFPFVAGLPKRERSRFQKLQDEFAKVKAIVAEKGMIVPSRLASKLLGVSQPRIDQLMDAGILERVELDGHPYVTEASIVAFANTERKAGRPPKLPTIKEAWEMSVEHGREMVKK
jgi:hypothetical protein